MQPVHIVIRGEPKSPPGSRDTQVVVFNHGVWSKLRKVCVFAIKTGLTNRKIGTTTRVGKNKKGRLSDKAAFFSELLKNYFSTSFTSSAASCKRMAECTCNPEASINSLPSLAFVPCKRTIIGMSMSPMFW